MHILQDANLRVDAGELVCLLGGNASGKSTTLKTVLGIVRPRTGTVTFDGEDVTGRSTSYRIGKGMAIVPENRRLFGPMTVLENLQMGAYLHGGGDAGGLRARVHALPAAVRATEPARRDALRRRAADGGDGAGAHGAPEAHAHGRAVDGARADPRRAELRDHQAGARCRRRDARSSSRTRTCRSPSRIAATCCRPAASSSRERRRSSSSTTSSARPTSAARDMSGRPDLTPGLSVRDEFPIFEHTMYANSCSQGALANRVRAAAEEWLAGWDENGAEWEFWVERNEAARAAFAGLLHAEPDDVAVTTSVSQGVSALVSALDLTGERNRIVISEYEFPTVGQIAHAQELRGAEVVHVRPEPDGRIPVERLRGRDRRADGARLLHGGVVPLGPPTRRERDRGARACEGRARPRGQLPGDRRARDRRAHARRGRRHRRHGQVPARLGRPRLHVAPRLAALGAPADADRLVRRRGHLRDVDRRLLTARDRAAIRQRHSSGSVALSRGRRDGADRRGRRSRDRGARPRASSIACSRASTSSARRS